MSKKKKLLSGYYDARTSTNVSDANIVFSDSGWKIQKIKTSNNNQNNNQNVSNNTGSITKTAGTLTKKTANADGFIDTGKKLGQYSKVDYNNRKDYKIYSKDNKFYFYNEKTKNYEMITNNTNNEMKSADSLKKSTKKENKTTNIANGTPFNGAVNANTPANGKIDLTGKTNKVKQNQKTDYDELSLQNKLKVDTSDLSKEERKNYASKLRGEEEAINQYNKPSKLGATATTTSYLLNKGITKGLEGVVDLGATIGSNFANKLGNKELSQNLEKWVKEDRTAKATKLSPKNEVKMQKAEDNTIIKRDNLGGQVVEALGGMVPTLLTGGVSSTVGMGAKGVTIASSIINGASSGGSASEEALQEGANISEATHYGILKGSADALTEFIGGGIPGLKGTAGGGLDKLVAKKLGQESLNQISKSLAKSIIKSGYKVAIEGGEEALSEMITPMLKNITYSNNEKVNWKNVIDSAIVGGVVGGILNAPASISDAKGVMANNAQMENSSSFNDILQHRINDAKNNNPKIDKKEIEKITKETKEDYQNGNISIDEIESALGGDTYQNYKQELDKQEEIQSQLDELGSKKMSDMTLKEYNSINSKISALEKQLSELKVEPYRYKLNNEMMGKVQNDSFLQKSYAEYGKSTRKFTYEPNEIDTPLTKNVYKSAEIMNDTKKAHNLVDFVAKISNDTGVQYEFTNTEKLKDKGYNISGERVINGLNASDGKVYINIDSNNALNRVVGHETTHLFENTDNYKTLQNAVFEYAKTKGEYDTRRKELENNYKGVNANIDNELTADLVGDYLFSDEKFVEHLSKDRNIFQKIYDTIKHLYKMATAGSKEKRQLEKVKRTFEKVYQNNVKTNAENKYSVAKKSKISDNLLEFEDNTKKSILSKSNNVIVENKVQLREYVQEALKDNSSSKNLHLGILPNEVINRIKSEITDINKNKVNLLFKDNIDYALAINQDEIRHLKKDSLSEQDVIEFVDSLDELVSNFDTVRYTVYNNNQNALRFKKKMQDGTHIALEVISNKNHTLRTHTLFLEHADFENKKRNIFPTLNEFKNSLSKTSKTNGLSIPSVNNVSQSNNNVKSGTTNNSMQNSKNYSLSNTKLPKPSISKSEITSKDVKIKLPHRKEINTLKSKAVLPVNSMNKKEKNTSKENKTIKLPVSETVKKANFDKVVKQDAKNIANTINASISTDTLTIKGNWPDLKLRKWLETSTESEVVDNKLILDDFNALNATYEVKSNRKSLEKANDNINLLGYEKSIASFNNLLNNRGIPRPEDVIFGERLLQEAIKQNDMVMAKELIENISIMGTELGQATQALSVIKRLTPEGQLKMLTKVVKRAKITGNKAFKDVEITPEMVAKILKTYNKDGTWRQKELDEAVEQVKKDIADQLIVSKSDKINEWRYLAMLGNPKTHIRNIVSNVAMAGTIEVKNAMARTIETLAPIKNRTKTWKKPSEVVNKYAKQVTLEMKETITGQNKYSEETSIERKKQVFNHKILDKASKFNSNALEAEDWFFSKMAFEKSFKEYLTAQNIKTQEDIDKNSKIIDKAKAYALEQAEIATFRQYSWLAKKISNIEQKNAVSKLSVGALIPFKKTPINIAKAGINYSPIGFVKAVSYDAYQVKHGNMEASQLIDNMCQGLTGSVLLGIGYVLAKAGCLFAGSDDDKEGKYDKNLGKQDFSIKIGDSTYSISWLSPVAMPLLEGASLFEELENKNGWDANIILDTISKTLDPLSSMSFLSGLTDALNSYSQNSAGMIKDIILNTSQSYALQFFPTLFSQLASTLDDKKRSTTASKDSSFVFGEQTVRQIMYKIPGLRNQLEVSTDIWGNEKEQANNLFERAFESFLAPYSKNKNLSTNLDKELKRVYQETDNTSVIPSVPRSYLMYQKEKYSMSASDYTQYKMNFGQTANNYLNKLIKTEKYKNADSEVQAKMIEKAFTFSKVQANEKYFKNSDVEYTNIYLNELKRIDVKNMTDGEVAEYIANKRYISN